LTRIGALGSFTFCLYRQKIVDVDLESAYWVKFLPVLSLPKGCHPPQGLRCSHQESSSQLRSMGNEFLDLQRLAPGCIAHKRDGLLWTVRDAHPAAHARRTIDAGESITNGNRRKLANVGARATAGTQIGIHPRHVPRRGDHRRAMLVSLHRPTAARAAVADGVEATEHSILVVVDTIEHVPSL
jgi:hypothetical protein